MCVSLLTLRIQDFKTHHLTPNLRDIEIADKCENYCTKVFVECLTACGNDDCYAECHRNDYICLDSKFFKVDPFLRSQAMVVTIFWRYG